MNIIVAILVAPIIVIFGVIFTLADDPKYGGLGKKKRKRKRW